ncbi:hypothetical protein H0H93_006836 [Arthromyces matolae]|nr:hypothetical protein H0H93_006836 [Arthromyces matolae]
MSLVKAGKTDPLQEFEAMVNVQHLLDDGGKHWFEHINRLAASTVLSATFGLHCPTGHESELTNIIDVSLGSRITLALPAADYDIQLLSKLVHLGAPTSSIINVFPFLDWIPGPMPWRSHAQSFRKRHDEFFESIVDEALTGKASGMNTYVITLTTAVSLHTFVLACIRYPHWVIAAQKEIDDIVGLDRLPTFKDRPYLPFIEAVVRETLRWRPAGRAIEHDKSRYSDDHDKFKPERFLDTEGKLKENYETSAFGFGRRICPGAPFAERSLWIDIATMLWMFNILPSKEIDPKTGVRFEYDDGDAAFKGDLTSAPYEFPAVFEPRSPEREEVARREWAECEKDLNVLLPMPK